jgi:transcription elongation GreA/GreB family factor
MSRAFVREQDVDTVEHLPDRPVSEHPNIVTDQGMAQIDTALAEARVAYAAAQVSSDRASIGAAAREVRYWSARRASAQLVPASGDTSEVRFGATVTIVRDDGREQTFRIVGEDEADPAKGSISHVSPLAKAMLGKAVGDVITAGKDEAEITSIVGLRGCRATAPANARLKCGFSAERAEAVFRSAAGAGATWHRGWW